MFAALRQKEQITSQYLRDRAQLCRRNAAETRTADIRDELLNLAREYDHDAVLMEMMERRAM